MNNCISFYPCTFASEASLRNLSKRKRKKLCLNYRRNLNYSPFRHAETPSRSKSHNHFLIHFYKIQHQVNYRPKFFTAYLIREGKIAPVHAIKSY
jgi:hypothetical protein